MTKPPREFELVAKRVATIENNLELAPLDLLRSIIDDIESGRVRCDSLMVIAIHALPTGAWDMSRYRANLTRERELALLTTSHYKAIREWIG